MTYPTVPVSTVNMDAGTDRPADARSNFLDLATKFNALMPIAADLAAPTGAGLVGATGGTTVQQKLDALYLGSVNVKDARFSGGAKGDGSTDDTTAIQAANDYLSASGGGTLIIPPGTYMINTTVNPTSDTFGGIKLGSNITLNIQPGATLKAIATSLTFTCVVQAYNKDNIRITGGGNIEGESSRHIGSTGEHGMGVLIRASRDVSVDKIEVSDCWGDGVYVGYATLASVVTASERVSVNHNNIHNCRRQGVSVVSCNTFDVSHNTIYSIRGAAPGAAIDLEPDSGLHPNTDGVIAENIGWDCAQGLTLYLANINIVATGNTFKSSGPALRIIDGQSKILVTGNYFESDNTLTESCFFSDASVFQDYSSVSVNSNIFAGGGSAGGVVVSAKINYMDFSNNTLITNATQTVPLVSSSNSYFYRNRIVATASAFSGVQKTFVYATSGSFGGNKYVNTTAQTPTYQYIGTSIIAFPEMRDGKPSIGDYTEGTWSPTIVASGTNFSGIAYDAVNTASYKILGNVCTIQGQLRTSSITLGSASGTIKIGNLPFAAASGVSAASINVGYSANWGSGHPDSGLISPSSTTIGLNKRATSNGASTDVLVADVSAGANGNITYFSGSYLVA